MFSKSFQMTAEFLGFSVFVHDLSIALSRPEREGKYLFQSEKEASCFLLGWKECSQNKV